MFYVAIMLMLIGLLSLLYIVLTASVEKKIADPDTFIPPVQRKEETATDDKESSPEIPERMNFPNGQTSVMNAASSIPDLPEPEMPAAAESNVPSVSGFEGTAKPLRPADTLLDRERLKEALKNLEKKSRISEKKQTADEPQILVAGILFFDHGRKIPERLDHLDDLPESFYQELKRAGEANLLIKGKKIIIQCTNAQYYYNASDLEQILFLPKGVGFVPLNRKRPVPVFLTENPSAVKNFVKQYSVSSGI